MTSPDCPELYNQSFPTMYAVLDSLHSYNRYLLLLALVFVLYRAYTGWLGKKPYEKLDNTASTALLGLTHLQLLLGLLLYFQSPLTTLARSDMGAAMKDSWQRYFGVEHLTTMIIAVVLIQLGRTFSKKAGNDTDKFKKLAIYTTIAALLIIGTLASKGLLFATTDTVVVPG